MRDENSKKSKLSWPKTLVKKWFNLQSKSEDFHADDIIYEGVGEEWRNNFQGGEGITIKKSKSGKSNRRNSELNNIDLDASRVTDVHNYRIFVATWNVAGKSPPSYLNLEEWLHTSPPADIYVLGFQEIVPLNAGNVLGTGDNGPARKWQALIRKTLNRLPAELDDDFEGSNREKGSSSFHRRSFQSMSRSMRMMESGISMGLPGLDRRFSVCDRAIYRHEPGDYYYPDLQCNDSSDDEDGPSGSPYTHYSSVSYAPSVSIEETDRHPRQSRYCLVASKQMVGIFLTVWIRSDLRDAVHNLKVSCVGRGLMGYLGNKGSISISMFLHQTSFCFVCSHLTSGEKDGDELRRNSDVMEILRKTRFPQVHAMGDENSPQTILDHDRIIWLGDLNYRIALAYRCAKALVEMRNWRALLENDQLRTEQRYGRVFAGWNEGNIYFPPTYKYSNNSDRYAGVIVYCGTVMVSDNYHTFVESRDFQIIDQYTVYFWQKSSPSTVAESRKVQAIQAPELKSKSCYHTCMDMDSQISSEKGSHLSSCYNFESMIKTGAAKQMNLDRAINRGIDFRQIDGVVNRSSHSPL